MPVAAIIPIRSFQGGKNRLAPILTGPERSTLVRALAARVLATSTSAGLDPVVITADEAVAEWAVDRATVLRQTGEGLDGAASDGARWARDAGRRWLVLHADLPLITPTDLTEISNVVAAGQSMLAPSSDGGTTAISSPKTISFSYGPLSAQRHLAQLEDPLVVARTGLLHDLDSPTDLASATSHPLGSWLGELYDAGRIRDGASE